MRMKDLESASGMPRSTIHYYLREGVLPPGEKSARNAASYDERHLQRLKAIDRLKKRQQHLPLGLLKRAAELMDRGVEPEVALELERAVVGGAQVDGSGEHLTKTQLAAAAGVPLDFVEQMISTQLLVPIPGPEETFDETDLRMVRALHPLAEATGLDLRVATRISETIRDLSRYEMALRNQAVAGKGEAATFELTLRIQEGVNLIHDYLFYRWRLHDIAELQRREAAQQDEPKGESP